MDKTGREMCEDFWRLASSTFDDLIIEERKALDACQTFITAVDNPDEGVEPSDDEKRKYKEYKRLYAEIYQFMWFYRSAFKKLKRAFIKEGYLK